MKVSTSDRVSSATSLFCYRMTKTLSGLNRRIRNQWLRAAQSIPMNIAEGNGKQSFQDKSSF
ncbi:MAG: four helix bundle protein [Pirellulaceae bacterium]